jgi:hypothetical protein
MSTLVESLTKDIVSRDLRAEGTALLNKWEKTGLLEGLDNDRTRNSMARLLENQAKELLREASVMNAGDVEGFSAVAFPIVRRVFGGLIANEVVSVQPMSLPSGLIFFLDFTYSSTTAPRLGGHAADASVYGGGVVASQITGGVDISGDEVEDGPYSLNNGYASPTGTFNAALTETLATTQISALTEAQKKLVRWDPDLLAETASWIEQHTFAAPANLNLDDLITIEEFGNGLSQAGSAVAGTIVRRLSTISTDDSTVTITVKHTSTVPAMNGITGSYAYADNFDAAGATGGVMGAALWPLENESAIPEIDIKVDSVAVTAMTKKLKAKWSPELGQDLNAYHNLDAEVELTSILSEQIALEIDQEVLNDLIKGATAGTKYWSRRPGKFVDRDSGSQVGATTAAPDFTGTVSEWYETLVETINDVSANIHRKTLRGGANFLVVSPELASLLEFTAGFRAAVSVDELKGGSVGAQKVGALSKKMDVFVDAYFPRNLALVGRRGNSFLECGYVYAPYVPLQVTPTIFGVEDFVPRKGVMTRYGKKMVRPDMYGLVIVQDLIG